MNRSRILPLVVASVVWLGASSVDAVAQGRGRSRGHSGAPVTGRAVPRPSAGATRPILGAPRIISPRVLGYAPYRPYYYPYRPGLTIGFYSGFGYPYGYGPYGYGYGYGYPYAYSYPYGPYGYSIPPPAYYSSQPGVVYGGVRIQGAPREGQVFADGYYVGIVDDFDGPFQHLNLEAGAHRIEIRAAGYPPVAFDVNVQPGQTMMVHAQMR